jgi:small-conductance mechanosensitive channel
MDSMRRERRRQHIDSLRKITPGVPLIIQDDTLFMVYAPLGGEDAEHRVANTRDRIMKIGKSFHTTTDSVHIFESDITSDIMVGQVVILNVSDLDGLWNGTSRQQLAEEHARIIQVTIDRLQDSYGMKAKLKGLAMAVVLIIVQVLFFILTARFIRWLRREIVEGLRGYLKPLVIKGYEVLSPQQSKRILLVLSRILQVVLVLMQLFISLPALFLIFPETEKFTWNMINYVWSPLRDIFISFVSYFPNLVKILVIIYVVRWILKVVQHMACEIEAGRLKIDRFYQDWAIPTYHIIRIFVLAFTVIVIWPLLPGSDSGIFKGVSIFVAALFSLGSTASIGNLVSGIIITYMRPFLVGDFVQIGDREGTVIEKNAFITRLRDIKDNIITVPNNSILSLPTVNYTAAVRQSGGTIVHSDFTFTYKVFRQQIEPLLLEAASRCQLLLKTPPPFVLITELEDFYTRYQINAYTQESQRLPEVYTELHRHILDVFRENNLEPTSSHFVKINQ